jgi:hypothetical protein
MVLEFLAAALLVGATDDPSGVVPVGVLAEQALVTDDLPPLATWRKGSWTLRARGIVTVDAIRHARDNEKNSGLDTRRATLVVTGETRSGLAFRVEPDLEGENTRHNMAEAWLSAPLGATHRVRAGLIRTSMGSEWASDPLDSPFVGLGFPSWLHGRTGWGVSLDGDPGCGTWWELAATSGAGAFDLDGRHRDDPQVHARWAVTPEPGADGMFDGFYGGVAVAHGPDYDDRVHLETPFEQTVFTTPDLDGGDARWLVWELGFVHGPLQVGFEDLSGALSDVPIGPGATDDMDQIGAFSLNTTYTLRGQRPRWQRGRWHAGPEPDAEGDLPLLLSARYSNADIDRAFFDNGITTYDPSTQEVRSFSASVQTWLDESIRLTFQWSNIIADHELSTLGGENRDSSFTLRTDVRF